MTTDSLLVYWLKLSFLGVGSYLFISACFFFGLKFFFAKYRLHDESGNSGEWVKPAKESCVSVCIFVAAFVAFKLFFPEHLKIYSLTDRYGLLYLPLSYFLLVIVTDFYFYLAHWLMHRLPVLKKYHSIHHSYQRTSCWAGFAFHPIEALVLSGMMPFALLLIPVHIQVLYFYLFIHLSINAYCHSGYSIFRIHRLDKYGLLNSSKRHYEHHYQGRKHLGLYLLVWPRLLPFFETTAEKP